MAPISPSPVSMTHLSLAPVTAPHPQNNLISINYYNLWLYPLECSWRINMNWKKKLKNFICHLSWFIKLSSTHTHPLISICEFLKPYELLLQVYSQLILVNMQPCGCSMQFMKFCTAQPTPSWPNQSLHDPPHPCMTSPPHPCMTHPHPTPMWHTTHATPAWQPHPSPSWHTPHHPSMTHPTPPWQTPPPWHTPPHPFIMHPTPPFHNAPHPFIMHPTPPHLLMTHPNSHSTLSLVMA